MTETPSTYLTGAVEDLCRMLANSALFTYVIGPIGFFLPGRLRRLVRRFAALMVKFEAGTLTPPRPRTGTARTERKTPAGRFPTRQMWVSRALPAVAFFQGRMATLLAHPQVQALIAAAPSQAGRVLRPLCRMVMTNKDLPAALKLPPRRRKPRPKAEPRRRLTPIRLTRAQIDRMTAAELTHLFGRLPPHFPLPIPNFRHIRRKIAAG